MYLPLAIGFVVFVLLAVLIGWATDPERGTRDPAQVLWQSGLVVAIGGAVLSVVAVFLTALGTARHRGVAVHVSNNSLLQAKDGWVVIILAVIGAALLTAAAYRRSRAAVSGTVIAAIAIVVLAIYDGLNLSVHYTAGAGQSGTLHPSAGVGVYLAAIGGAIMAIGAYLTGREVPRLPARPRYG